MAKHHFPPGYPLLQAYARSRRQVQDPIGSMVESMERFGGTYSVNLGFRRFIITQDPGFIEYVLKTHQKNYHKSALLTQQLARFVGNGLLTANGEYWLRQRRLIQPGFHGAKVRALYGIMKRTAERFADSFPVGSVDVYPLMNAFAFEVVINTLFNIEIPHESRAALSRFITETQDFVMRDIRQPLKSWWFRISGEVQRHSAQAEEARSIIRDLIHTRKKSGKRCDDLLDMLLDARYEDTGMAMEEAQVIDEILILLIAGHETTANALSWTLHLLAGHRSHLAHLRSVTRNINTDQVVVHPWLNAAINEAMRLYPPAWISDRVALKDDRYGAFTFPAGTIVLLFYYGLHRDSKWWNDPAAFLPARFITESGSLARPAVYYPFGAGPRMCIGNNFAMAEMTLFLHTMIHRFDFFPSGVVPRMKPLITLRPDAVVLNVGEVL